MDRMNGSLTAACVKMPFNPEQNAKTHKLKEGILRDAALRQEAFLYWYTNASRGRRRGGSRGNEKIIWMMVPRRERVQHRALVSHHLVKACFLGNAGQEPRRPPRLITRSLQRNKREPLITILIQYSCVADEAAFILGPPLQRQRQKLTSVSGDPGKNQTLPATFDFSAHGFRPVNKSSSGGTRWRTDKVPRT